MEAAKRPNPTVALLLSLTLCYSVSFIGWIATERGLGFWYTTLLKPSFNPPMWVFAPVWTVLYALMGFAAYLVWKSGVHGRLRSAAWVCHLTQLALNALWSWLFFGFQRLDLGLYEIFALLAAIIATTVVFFRARPIAGWLMVPYLAWVCFAALLNFSLYQLNR